MQIDLRPREAFVLKKIARAAWELGMETYAVGGFVRDKLLGRPTKDIDIVCVGDGIALATAVSERFAEKPRVTIFKTYGTAQIVIPATGEEPALEVEFVGARTESYQPESRNPEVAPGSLEDDQLRRDFTVNALAVSLNEENYGALVDPFNGLKDMELSVLRTPRDPLVTFSDDPLRMMRAIRFASQLGFRIHGDTLTAITQMAGRISIITQERITDEFNKILLSSRPGIGLELLGRTGLMEKIFPQFMLLSGAEYVDGKGHKDNFFHTLEVVNNMAAKTGDLWLRWAALLHDIAKPQTKRFEPGHGWTFHGHEAAGARMVPKIFNRFKLPLTEPMRRVQRLVELHLRPIALTKENITDSAVRRLLFDAGDYIDDLMLLCECDITSKNAAKVQRYLRNFLYVKERMKEVEEKDHLRNWQPPVTGHDVIQLFALKPGREVGKLKELVREAILDGLIPNDREHAFVFLLEKAAEMDLKPVLDFRAIAPPPKEETALPSNQ